MFIYFDDYYVVFFIFVILYKTNNAYLSLFTVMAFIKKYYLSKDVKT